MMGHSVAGQLAEVLGQVGVRHFYSISGDSLNVINHAISHSQQVEWIQMRHEESGAFAASAEAFLNGLGCCGGSCGPGHVHLLNGLYDANHGNNPVIAIATMCESNVLGSNYFQETNPIKLFDDCSVYNQVALNAYHFSHVLPDAVSAALGREGVAVVALPRDVAELSSEEIMSNTPRDVRTSVKPSQQQLHALADMIVQSKKTCLFCGIGVEKAHKEVIKLARLIKAPIAYTFKGKMEIEYQNPYGIGMTGVLGLPSAYVSMFDADLLIMLGTDFPYRSFLPSTCKVAQIDIRAERLGRRTNVDLSVHGAVRETLRQLFLLVEERTSTAYLERCRNLYVDVVNDLQEVAKQKGSYQKIAPEYLTALIDKRTANNTIFTVDSGMCCTWAARFINATKERELIASYNHGCMGNALPMAIGAALARPDQPVVALCGDGGISMLLGELMTVKQYELPIKIIVYKNRTLGMVKLEMNVAGLVNTHTELTDPDFVAIAKGMGLPAFSVSDPEKLDSELKNVLAHVGPALLEVYTDPNALSLPPKLTLGKVKGFSMSMAQMLFSDQRKEMVDSIKNYLKLLQS